MTRFILDVSNVSTQPFLTGIQRTIRGVARDNSDRFELVRFDETALIFRRVDQIPKLKRRGRSVALELATYLLAPLFLLLSRSARGQKKRIRLPGFAVKTGRRLHHFLFNDSVLEDDPSWRENSPWVAQKGDVFLILEVPQDKKHLNALVKILSQRELIGFPRVCVYLYDLIPIRQALEYDPRPPQMVSGSFPDFVDFVRGVDDVIFLSHFTKKEYLDLCETTPGKLKDNARGVLYLPLPTRPETVDRPRRETVEIKVLGIGALDRRKNFIVVLRALEHLSNEGIEFRAKFIAGTGKLIDPRVTEFFRSAKEDVRSRIEVLSYVSEGELATLYSWSTVVVVPSLAEGFGLPVVEAIANGRNVIASDCTSLSELADYFDVKLAQPHDSDAWSRLLEESSGWGAPKVAADPLFPQDWRQFADRLIQEISRAADA